MVVQVTEDKLLDFHVYRRAIFNTPADKRWCVASVWDGRAGSHQCGRKPKHQYGGHGWCTQHYPPNVQAKHEARTAKWHAESNARTEMYARINAEKKLKDAALEAIKKIAAGHNDPRGLAQEVLDDGN